MENSKRVLIKIAKYTFVLAAAVTILFVTLFVTLMAVLAEEIKIGSNDCGIYIKQNFFDLALNPSRSKGYYNPTDCMLCLGKIVVKRETEKSIGYNCVGIKFKEIYE